MKPKPLTLIQYQMNAPEPQPDSPDEESTQQPPEPFRIVTWESLEETAAWARSLSPEDRARILRGEAPSKRHPRHPSNRR